MVTFKSEVAKETSSSKSFDKLEDLSEKSSKKDSEISDSFVVLPKGQNGTFFVWQNSKWLNNSFFQVLVKFVSFKNAYESMIF